MIWLEVILSPFELILSAGSFRKAGGIDIEEGSRLDTRKLQPSKPETRRVRLRSALYEFRGQPRSEYVFDNLDSPLKKQPLKALEECAIRHQR